MVAADEEELEARAMGISLSPEERFEVFGEHDPARYDGRAPGPAQYASAAVQANARRSG